MEQELEEQRERLEETRDEVVEEAVDDEEDAGGVHGMPHHEPEKRPRSGCDAPGASSYVGDPSGNPSAAGTGPAEVEIRTCALLQRRLLARAANVLRLPQPDAAVAERKSRRG